VNADPLSRARIESATEADLPAISALAAVIWRAYYPAIISKAQIDYMLARMYSIATMREEIRAQGIFYERLFVGEDFIGFASYGPTGQPGEYKLHKLYLVSSCHGRGLGSLLLRHCERAAHKLGAQRLILAVNKRNTKAIAAYQRNGYRIVDSVVVDIGGGFVMDDYVMAKDLNAVME
jgi:GNAT superfamily N-acetyltransferase